MEVRGDAHETETQCVVLTHVPLAHQPRYRASTSTNAPCTQGPRYTRLRTHVGSRATLVECRCRVPRPGQPDWPCEQVSRPRGPSGATLLALALMAAVGGRRRPADELRGPLQRPGTLRTVSLLHAPMLPCSHAQCAGTPKYPLQRYSPWPRVTGAGPTCISTVGGMGGKVPMESPASLFVQRLVC